MDQFNGLSNREREVVKLLLEGKSNKLIASALHITDNTVEFHLKNIYSKVQVSSRTELIVKLGNSVVADKEGIVENRDRLNLWNWLTPLREAVSRICKELKMENVLNSTAHNGANPMTFYESIIVCLKKYADFNGRASRPEFWWFTLFITLVASAFAYVSQTLMSIFLIAALLPLLAAGTRRLRDSGTSAWWLIFLLAPVGGIVLLGFLWARPTTSPQPDDTLPV
jgi:DNA-binding CsgD family transcriptional regulator